MTNGTMRRITSSISCVAIGLLAACACAVAWGLVEFGSLRAVVGYVQGYAVVPDSFSRDLGPIRVREKTPVQFRLTNVSGASVKVLGANTTCTCMLVSELPMVIDPGHVADFSINVRPGPSNVGKPFSHDVELYLDAPSVPVVLTISAEVRAVREEKRSPAS